MLSQALDEERRLRRQFLEKTGGSERISDLRAAMQEAMEAGAGIYRDGSGLNAAIATIHELQERFSDVTLDDPSLTFNTELVSCLELENMLDFAETILHSAVQRRESRGAHQRTDYPERDDDEFLAHSLAYRSDNGAPRIDYLPVTITRWPPSERVYGR